ncbi:MAG: hypothetical protein ACXW2C_00090 [Acidimicrobiia bacterium]
MITQPATTGASRPTRPIRLLAFGKLLGLVVAIGTVAALAIAGAIGVAALLVTSASG